jgi:IclR family transcriptional regulator, KDG regulon repressor
MGQSNKMIASTDSGVLAHICRILDCFTPERTTLGVREVARLTDLSSSTVGRLMKSMLALDILQQNNETKQYQLGIRLLIWTGVYLASLDIRSTALPVMSDLQATTLETISLYILDGTDRVCVERLESPQRVRIVTRLGLRLPLYAGSAGKVILAYLTQDKRETILSSIPLQPYTRHTITDIDQLKRDLSSIQERGYAYSHGEWIEDASGVAAPIYDSSGEVSGALTISGPSQRFNQDVIKNYGKLLIPAAMEISRGMGYTRNSSYVKIGTRQ